MKKLLALVLALVMTLSLAVVGSNAAFKDAEKVNASYAEAVDVLSGMKVFQGYPDGSFQPEGSITRAEVAAIVYRLYTADVADKQASLYATYNKFTDMGGAAWAAGYIGYCANAGLIKGYDAKTFGPADKVTGYQALAMILRAVGYDKNDEFTGAQWQLRVASTAQQLGILKNVKGVDLNAAASRELVAELLFRTAAEVPMVTYTPALGYTNLTAILNGKTNATLGYKNFGLTKSADQNDAWGRPYYTWYGEYNNVTGYQKNTKDAFYATVKATPVKTYTAAVKECDVASDLGLTAKTTYTSYINGVENKATFTVEPTDTINVLGAQGRLVEVYEDRIVMIDTYLAQVTGVTAATFDKAGHLDKYATLTLRVYDATTHDAATGKTIVEYSSSDYSFVKGDYVLLNAKTTAYNNVAIATKAATINGASKTVAAYAELLGKAETVTGAQTSIIMNAKQHVVGGTNYNDANTYYLDEAQNTPFTNYTWFLDSYGNVIGSAKVASTYTYAILKDMVWNLGTPGSATATLVNAATGEVTTATVNAIDGDDDDTFDWDTVKATPVYGGQVLGTTNYKFDNAYAYVAPETFLVNSIYKGYALYRVETLSTGAVNLEGKDAIGYVANGYINNKATSLQVAASPNQWLPIDDNTVFTVKVADTSDATGYSYQQYVGKNNVPNISGATFFYVDANKDGVLDYVYVKAGTADNSGKNFVVATSNTYYASLYNNVKNVWVLTEAMVNGEVKQNTVTADKAADAQTLTTKVNGHFAPYYVTYAPTGYIATVTPFADSANGNGVETKAGSGIYYAKMTKAGILANGLLVNGSSTFSLSSANVYGDYTKETLSTISDWTSVDVYAVWTQDALQLNGQYNRTISQLYVYNKGTNGSDGNGSYQGPATLSLTGVNKNLTATLTLPEVVGGTRVELQYRPYSSNGAWATYTASMPWTDGSINPYYYTSTVSGLTGNYEFRAVAYNAAGTEIAVSAEIVPVYF